MVKCMTERTLGGDAQGKCDSRGESQGSPYGAAKVRLFLRDEVREVIVELAYIVDVAMRSVRPMAPKIGHQHRDTHLPQRHGKRMHIHATSGGSVDQHRHL